MAGLAQFRWTSAARSHVGLIREVNEDACLDRPQSGLWAVADGMGGHSQGDFASRAVVDSLNRIAPTEHVDSTISRVRLRLEAVNRQLREEAALRDVSLIGSTVVVLVACQDSCSCLWVGDSRLYLFRNGRLKQLTRDHSLIEELRARGELPPEDSVDYPSRNHITRAVGTAETLDLDEQSMQVNDDDMFLLCSDGLSNEVSEQEMASALVMGNCRQAAESLVDIALKHGGRDNVSVVVARAEDPYSQDRTVLNPAA
ncbi:PP2C family protein-serine/threonine phosphatase [Dechloromonas hankyongensis]|uniref:PP2C family protein-serine/threonine phosphatase n=1 Tax=Dechloromonas hankyongensis TaxID=2908002 RepID=UPI003B8494F9